VSERAHPNLHAAGLVVDIVTAVERRLRGPAAQQKARALAAVSTATMNEIAELVVTVSYALDLEFLREDGTMATITINEGLTWVKTLRERHTELVALRNENSAVVKRHYGVGGDKETERKPVYDVKALDKMVTRVAREIQKLEQAIKVTNATTTIVGYEKDEAVLGELT